MPTSASKDSTKKALPDAARGILLSDLKLNVPLAARLADEEIVVVRTESALYAVGAKCTHFGAPLSQGRVFEGAIHCPWHHAAFCLSDGHTERAPGLDPIKSYDVVVEGQQVRVTKRRHWSTATPGKHHPPQVTFIGAGAATYAAVLALRHAGFSGPITVFGSEQVAPYDRVKLSKGYLQGKMEDQSLSLTTQTLKEDRGTDWRLGVSVERIDLTRRILATDQGEHPFSTLVLATGARPRRLDIRGADKPHVLTLRTLADARQLVSKTTGKKRIAVVGAGFIGLEAAAQLSQAGHTVEIIAPKGPPMAPIVGQAVAEALEAEHRQHGTKFHWGDTVVAVEQDGVVLSNNTKVVCDVVLLALGVVPNVELAEAAGLKCDNGIIVDGTLRTEADQVFAIGDVANFPSPYDQQPLRIEHWSVAEQMGFVVADNILGHRRVYNETPFFWTEHHSLKLRYVGHVRKVAHAETFGSIAERRAAIVLSDDKGPRAVLTCGRDDLALLAREALEQGKAKALPKLLADAV